MHIPSQSSINKLRQSHAPPLCIPSLNITEPITRISRSITRNSKVSIQPQTEAHTTALLENSPIDLSVRECPRSPLTDGRAILRLICRAGIISPSDVGRQLKPGVCTCLRTYVYGGGFERAILIDPGFLSERARGAD